MEIKGKVIQVLAQEVVGQNQKKKQTFIVETMDQYPKKVAIDSWDDKVVVSVGEIATFHINAESREWNNKWFTNLSAWKKEVGSQAAPTSTPQPAQAPVFTPPAAVTDDTDLPF